MQNKAFTKLISAKVAVFVLVLAIVAGSLFATNISTEKVVSVADAASVDYFLKIPGVPGEATDQEHKEWIIIESMSSPIFRDTAGAHYEPIVIRKRIDKATPKLMEAVARGTSFPDMTFESSAQGREGRIKIHMKDVIVSSINPESDTVPTETMSLNYGAIKFEYYASDGSITAFDSETIRP